MAQNQYDAALDQVNAAIRAAPQNPAAYALRGDIYAAKKLWDQAEEDYQTVLQIDGTSVQIKFNLAQVEFAQNKYDAARPRFAALQHDPDMGDLAAYKVFLCDLLGGHENVAAKELDAFNRVGSNASYYFANAGWSLYHQKREDAHEWLLRAGYIYAPYKFRLYGDSLIGLGNRGTSSAPSPPTPAPSTRPKP
jgi:tetratricopeptide (TPR) repeat protein